ncbi:hypothetical protein Pint_13306 [Pistacia integerrima]|uniref:Uncharacterized protein n=1 Tax=Pistacia integerrima TaxID=434235 RepID=A0ACC0Y877_9ROSI|nr:hypothetical protein Pint_13306 [Pistacia integerrima]
MTPQSYRSSIYPIEIALCVLYKKRKLSFIIQNIKQVIIYNQSISFLPISEFINIPYYLIINNVDK